MFKSNFKKQALTIGAATLALAASQSAMAAFVLAPNGDFETGGADWGVEPADGATFDFPVAGGNPGGHLVIDSSTAGAWGGVAFSATADANGAVPLSHFGASAGGTYDFKWDQICLSGASCTTGGMKLEAWNAGGLVDFLPDTFFTVGDSWTTNTLTWTIPAGADSLKFVPLGIDTNSTHGFDNVGMEVPASVVPVPAAVWLFGSGLLGLVGVARRKA